MVKYGNNNYKTFLSLASDAETLDQLSDALNCVGLEGTPLEGDIEGVVNQQYEIVQSGNALMVYDHDYKERVFITGREELFNDMIDEEIRRRCEGLDYNSWLHLQNSLSKSD
jgi:hypothetical protein